MQTIFLRFKSGVLILFFLFASQHLTSQDNCSSTLEKAEILFEQGIIEDIPGLLAACIRNGLTTEEKKRAQKLVILSYLFDNKAQQAENAMESFLRSNPEYKIQPGDPAEFTSLFSSFRTFPYLSLGAFLGGNLTSASMLEPYGPYNHNIDNGQFSILPEMQIGAAAYIFLSNRLELNIETIYSRNSFSYTNLQYGFAEVYKKETHQRLEFPVLLSYDLNNNKLNPYFRIGASYGFILSAHSTYKRTNLNELSEALNILESSNMDISNSRTSGTFNAIMGAGIKYKIARGFVIFDMKYSYGLSNLVNPENRWDQETVFRYYHADGDFMTDNLSFSIGYRYSFYKSTKL
jgi:hypothetical protein